MSTKEILKSPLYLVTLGICIFIVIAVIFFAFGQNGDDTQVENGILDLVYETVLKDFDFNLDEIDSFSIIYDKKTEPDIDGSIYQISITVDDEIETFTATVFSSGTVETVKNTTDTERESKTDENTTRKDKITSDSTNKNSKYADIETVKEHILMDSLLQEEKVNFLSVVLDESGETPLYEIVFETKDGYRKYIYHANALNGLLRDRTYYNADDVWDEENIFWYWENEEDDGASETYTYYNIWENLKKQSERGGQSFYDEPVYAEEYSAG